MKNQKKKNTIQNYFGLGSAEALKAFVIEKNRALLENCLSVALVKESMTGGDLAIYVVARKARSEVLYAILPDCKELVVAKFRSERKDIPYIFEVLA